MKPFMRRKMLVVEDCASDVYLLQRMLGDAGGENIAITSVPRLVDAFHQIDHKQFDLILLDLNLLDMDGIASVAALGAEAPRTPIIVYSGTRDSKLREEALLCGACDFLVKGEEDGRSLQNAIFSALGRPNSAPVYCHA